MKVIIAGPRDLEVPNEIIEEALHRAREEKGIEMTELVNGMCATGVDASALRWYREGAGGRGMGFKPMPAPWDYWENLGLGSREAAGPYRNREMAAYADALIVLRHADRDTPGTKSMLYEASKAQIPVYIQEVQS